MRVQGPQCQEKIADSKEKCVIIKSPTPETDVDKFYRKMLLMLHFNGVGRERAGKLGDRSIINVLITEHRHRVSKDHFLELGQLLFVEWNSGMTFGTFLTFYE